MIFPKENNFKMRGKMIKQKMIHLLNFINTKQLKLLKKIKRYNLKMIHLVSLLNINQYLFKMMLSYRINKFKKSKHTF